MAQAKTLAPAEIDRLLAHVDTRKYAARNRAMVLLTHWAGLRIGEVTCLRWSDVLTSEGQIKDEVRLLPNMTKGRQARTVFINARLKAELQAYVAQAVCVDRQYPLFASQKFAVSADELQRDHLHAGPIGQLPVTQLTVNSVNICVTARQRDEQLVPDPHQDPSRALGFGQPRAPRV